MIKADRVGGILTFCLGIVFVHQGIQLYPGTDGAPGSGFFPMWVGVCLMALSLLLLIRPLGSKTMDEVIPQREEGKRVLLTLVILVMYTLLLKSLGFIIATFLLFLILLQLFERGRWGVAIAISLAAVLGSYWLFVKFFDLVLPGGLLPL